MKLVVSKIIVQKSRVRTADPVKKRRHKIEILNKNLSKFLFLLKMRPFYTSDLMSDLENKSRYFPIFSLELGPEWSRYPWLDFS